VLRGKFVRENLLCQDVPAPPPNVKVDVPMTGTSQTARRAIHHARERSECSACHKMFDGLGFAFENYDALGRYRTLDNGKAHRRYGDGARRDNRCRNTVQNAIDLVQTLAASEQTYRCFAQRLFESFGDGNPCKATWRTSSRVRRVP